LGVLDYAMPTVRTSPPRSLWRMAATAAWRCVRVLLACVRLSILTLGYATLGAGIVLRFSLGIVAMVLLFVGGMRWSIVQTRTLHIANWVDRKTLEVIERLRGLVRFGACARDAG
jgi:hypothetical protein